MVHLAGALRWSERAHHHLDRGWKQCPPLHHDERCEAGNASAYCNAQGKKAVGMEKEGQTFDFARYKNQLEQRIN